MEIVTRNNSTIVVTNHVTGKKPPGTGISANSFSKLLLEFEDFVASSDPPGVVRSASSSNRPPPPPGTLNSAKAQLLQQQQQCNRPQQPVNNSKMHIQFNKFGDYPTQHKTGLRSMLTRSTYTRRSSQGSPTSTHSSPILYTSSSTQSSPNPSSTHSSPILHTQHSPSPTPSPSPPHSAPSSHIPHVPPSMLKGVVTPATPAAAPTNPGQGNPSTGLASKRDPVTNKIVIKKPLAIQKKDKYSVTGKSKSVITPKRTLSLDQRIAAAAAESVKGQSGAKGSSAPAAPLAPFSLPPLSVKSTDNQKLATLPDLLKPNFLAKYVQASAPKKKPVVVVEKSSPSNSVLLDHDYSRAVQVEKPVEKKFVYKRKFVIPKKRAGSDKTQDNLEVVDMECSDTENDGGDIVVDDFIDVVTEKNEEPSPEVVDMLLYGRDTFRTECKLIDEEAELRYINEPSSSTANCVACEGPLRQINTSDLIETLSVDEVTCDTAHIPGFNTGTSESELNAVSWWQEIEDIVKSISPDIESSPTLPLTREEEDELIMMSGVIDDDTFGRDIFDDLLEFCPVPGFAAKTPDPSLDTSNLSTDQLDVKLEVVECPLVVSEVVVTTEEQAEAYVNTKEPTGLAKEPVVAFVHAKEPTIAYIHTKEPTVLAKEPVAAYIHAKEPTIAYIRAKEPTVLAKEPVMAYIHAKAPTVLAKEPVVAYIRAKEPTIAYIHAKEPTVTKVSKMFIRPADDRPVGGEVVQVVGGRQYVSLLDVMPQSASETSDTGSMSSDDSKENMLDKVPAYILTSGRLGTKKNVLQRVNVQQDSEAGTVACNDSWDDSQKKFDLSPDSNSCSTSNGYESGSPSPSEFSDSRCRSRSPSPDYARNYSSHLSRRSNRRGGDYYRQRQGRSRSRSRSRSPSYSSYQQTPRARLQREADRNDEEEQRRVVYVGKLPNSFTDDQLITLFRKHGDIEKVSLHFRSAKDNYGFVTFVDKRDATRCLEVTNQNPRFPYEVCYGGRREFCKEEYADLDGITEQREEFGPVVCGKSEGTSFEQLLKQYSRARRH